MKYVAWLWRNMAGMRFNAAVRIVFGVARVALGLLMVCLSKHFIDVTIKTGSNEDILDKLNSINIYGDPTHKHTLTLFYIERGRIESNCLITFNFELADKLTVSNTVNADNVNAALKAETLQVA